MTKTIVTDRRQVLRGAGGFTLALPFLPSLAVPARSYAQAVPAKRKRFFAFCNSHGAVNPADMFPTTNQTMTLFPGHTINYGKLVRTVANGNATICPVLSAPDTVLTDAMASRVNIVRGLDTPFYFSHGDGGYLGNIAGNDGVAGGDQLVAQKTPNVTIDQQMAWSPSFYAGGIPRQRSITRMGYGNASNSYTWSSPTTRSGNIQRVGGNADLTSVFDALFGGGVMAAPPGMPVAQRPLIVDKVLASYKSLRDGNARLSVADKQRLTDHLSRMDELQRKITALQKPVVPLAACKAPGKPAYVDWHVGTLANYYNVYSDMVAMAFICDTTRIAVEGYEGEHEAFINYPSGGSAWHDNVAHQFTTPTARTLLMQQSQSIFQNLMLYLAKKLDVDEGLGDGSTVLDNSLLFWSQESGFDTHVPLSVPVVTIGSAGGYFKTGNYVDFRNQVPGSYYASSILGGGSQKHYAGITYNRMMSNVLLAMGVDPVEWKVAGRPGFGHTLIANGAKSYYSAAMLAAADDPLPIIT